MPKTNILVALAGVIFTIAFLFLLSETNLPIVGAQVASTPKLLANLTDAQHIWKAFGATNLSQYDGNLTISVLTDYPEKLYNRAFLTTEVKSSEKKPTFLSLDYISRHILFSSNSNPIFVVEIKDQKNGQILWTSFLNNTSGGILNEMFPLPSTILNKLIEVRVYIITQGVASHSTLSLKDAHIVENNKDSAEHYLNTKQLTDYPVTVGNKTFHTSYDIYGAELNGIKIDESKKKLNVNLISNTNGILIMDLPRNLTDVKNQSNTDAEFRVLVDGQNSITNEFRKSNTTIALAIEFKQGTKLVELWKN